MQSLKRETDLIYISAKREQLAGKPSLKSYMSSSLSLII